MALTWVAVEPVSTDQQEFEVYPVAVPATESHEALAKGVEDPDTPDTYPATYAGTDDKTDILTMDTTALSGDIVKTLRISVYWSYTDAFYHIGVSYNDGTGWSSEQQPLAGGGGDGGEWGYAEWADLGITQAQLDAGIKVKIRKVGTATAATYIHALYCDLGHEADAGGGGGEGSVYPIHVRTIHPQFGSSFTGSVGNLAGLMLHADYHVDATGTVTNLDMIRGYADIGVASKITNFSWMNLPAVANTDNFYHMQLGAGTILANGDLTLLANEATVVPWTIKAAESQSADLFQVTSSADALLARFTSAGALDLPSGALDLSKLGAANRIEVGAGQTSSQYAYIDLIGDTTYTDYGLRLMRYNTGANANSLLEHRGTGILGFWAYEAATMSWGLSNASVMTLGAGGALRVSGSVGILEGGATPSKYSIFQGGDQSIDLTYTLPTGITTNGFLRVAADGTLSWSTAPLTAMTPGGSDTQVQFNDGGVLAGDSGLTFTKATDVLYVGGKVGIGRAATYPLDVYVSGATFSVMAEVSGDYFPFYRLKRSGGTTKTNVEWSIGVGSTGNLVVSDGTTTPLRIDTATGLITLGVDGLDIQLGTVTGTKIGTAAAQKLGFFGATPVVQRTHLADPAADAATLATWAAAINLRLEQLGFMATS